MIISTLFPILSTGLFVLWYVAPASGAGLPNYKPPFNSPVIDSPPITQRIKDKREDGVTKLNSRMRLEVSNETLRSEGAQTIPHSLSLPMRQLNNHGKGPCAKGRPRYVEVFVAFDATFCKQFANGKQENVRKVVDRLFASVEMVFRKNTCVRIRVQGTRGACETLWDDFSKPSDLNKCSRSGRGCSPSESIMNEVRGSFYRGGFPTRHDVVFFFSGFGEGTSVAGAAFRNGMCDGDFGFSWVEGIHSEKERVAIITHEMGHLLGADHAASGIMQKVINPRTPIILSSKSVTEIVRFIDEDPRSWCLARDISTDNDIRKRHDWVGANLTLDTVMPDDPDALVYDVSFVTDSTAGSKSLFILGRTASGPAYRVVRNVQCTTTGRCGSSPTRKSIKFFNIPAVLDSFSNGFSIATANVRSPSDIIVSYVRKIADKAVAFYTVGYGKSLKADERTSWSPPRPLPSDLLREFVGSAIAAAQLSKARSTDILWLYIDKRNGRNIPLYRVGFSLDSHGKVSGGWTDEIRVPVLLGGSIWDVSIAIHDVTGSGRPDLVFLYQDGTSGTNAIFYRVGRDLDSQGHVTGGWSNHMRLPVAESYPTEILRENGHVLKFTFLLSSGVAIADLLKGKPTMVVPTLERSFRFGPLLPVNDQGAFIRPGTIDELATVLPGEQYLFGRDAFSGLSFDLPKLDFALADISYGCFLCYNPEQADECAKDLRWCASQLDEVIFQGGSISKETVPVLNRQRVDMRSEVGKRLLYCDGFDFLFKQEDNCGITDNRRVFANGIIQGLLSILNKEAPNEFEVLEYFDDIDDSGALQTPNRSPTAPYVVFGSGRQGRRETLLQAMRMLRKTHQDAVGAFSTRVVRYGKKWKVIILFKKRYLKQLGG